MGRWKNEYGNWTVEGEWKDGLLNGKVVEYWDAHRDEYEAKDGK